MTRTSLAERASRSAASNSPLVETTLPWPPPINSQISAVIPTRDLIKGTFANLAHRAVAVVVQNEHDRVEAEPNGGGDFGAGHLERAVADEHVGTEIGSRHGDADAGGDGESHRHVISRAR